MCKMWENTHWARECRIYQISVALPQVLLLESVAKGMEIGKTNSVWVQEQEEDVGAENLDDYWEAATVKREETPFEPTPAQMQRARNAAGHAPPPEEGKVLRHGGALENLMKCLLEIWRCPAHAATAPPAQLRTLR